MILWLEVNRGFLEKLPSFSLIGTAENGGEALEKVLCLKPDLVLLDVYLPDMSGVEILTKLRAERVPSDVIMITAAKRCGNCS